MTRPITPCPPALRSSLLVLAGLLTGCFAPFPVPDDFVASCETDTDCLSGDVCLDTGVCGPRPVPPPDAFLGTPEIAPARGGTSTTFEVTVPVYGAIELPPEVKIDTGEGLRALPVDELRTHPTEGVYGYSYQPLGDEREGDRALVATLFHANGTQTPDLAIGSVHLDFTAPRLEQAELSAELLGPTDTLVLDVVFGEPLSPEGPTAVASRDGGEEEVALVLVGSEVTPDDTTLYHFSLPSTELAGDGVWTVHVTASDPYDNEGVVEAGAFERDTRPANSSTSGVVLVPEPGNPLLAPAALRVGGQAQVVVTFDEALTEIGVPALDCPGADVDATLTVEGSNPLILRATVNSVAAPVEVVCAWTLAVADRAGNPTLVDVAVLPIDTLPPDAADVDTGLLRHVRIPWGADVTGGVPQQQVVPIGDEATSVPPVVPASVFAAFPSLTRLDAFSAEGAGALLLAQSVPVAGGFAPLALQSADSAEVWLSVLDGAGNASDRVRVDEVEWVATLVGNDAGPTVANPNRLTQVPRFRGYPLDANALDVGHQGALSAIDGTALRVEAPLATEPPFLQVGFYGSTLTIDPLRGRHSTVDYQGLWTFERNNTWLFDSGNLPGVWYDVRLAFNPITERMHASEDYTSFVRVNGLWSRLGNPQASGAPVVDVETGLVVAPRIDGFWSPQTTVIDRDLQMTVFPSPEMGYRGDYGLAATGVPGELLLFGGWSDGTCPPSDPFAIDEGGACLHADTWRFDGTSWSQVSVPASPGPRGAPSLVYDAAYDRVVLVGGVAIPDGQGCVTLPGTEPFYEDCLYRDAWAFQDDTWSPLPPPPVLAATPGAAYDASRGEVVLSGGFHLPGDPFVFWRLQGTTWTRQSTLLERPFTYINAQFQLALHPPSGKVVFMNSNGELYTYDEGVFTRSPTPTPETGCDPPLVYEPSTQQMVFVDTCQQPMETWRYDVDTDVWTQATGAAPPGNRMGTAAAWHAPRGRVVLYGGSDGQSDTWSLNGNGWVLEPAIPAGPISNYNRAITDGTGSFVLASRVNNNAAMYRLEGNAWVPLPTPPAPGYAGFTALVVSHEGDPILTNSFDDTVQVLHDGAWTVLELLAPDAADDTMVADDDGTYLYLSANEADTVVGIVPPADQAITALVGRFPFSEAAGPDPRACLDDSCPIHSVQVRAVAGPGHGAGNPLRVTLYDPRSPVLLGEGTGDLSATLTDDDAHRLGRVFATEGRDLFVTASSTVGRGPDLSSDFVDLDYLEVRVRYRQP